MFSRHRSARVSPVMLLRMAADALMVMVSLATGVALRLLWVFLTAPPDLDGAAHVQDAVGDYFRVVWGLTAVCLVVFFYSGFYTYSRTYSSRYKAVVVAQAVVLGYLIFGFLSYFIQLTVYVHRGALALGCLITIAVLVGSRVWSHLWETMVRPERERLAEARRNRRVLVIGGAGYIGSALLPKLLAAGWDVRVLDMMIFGEAPIADLLDHPRLELIRGDFRHVERVVLALRDVDAVVHLGGIVGDPACSLDEAITVDINLSASRMIAELAKIAGVKRFVFASTCSVYGAGDETLDERSRVQPVSLYGHTKLASEKVLAELADKEFAPTVLRFATIYGLSGRTRFDLVVNLLAAKAKIDGEITIHGGNQWRPFCHVDDAAAAVARVLEAPVEVVGGEVFNVGSDAQNYTIAQVGELVRQQAAGAEVRVAADNTDPRNYRVSFRKIRDLLDFQPQWTVEQGIRQVLEAIAGGDIEDYRESRYSNVKFLMEEGADGLARDGWAREMIRESERHAAGA